MTEPNQIDLVSVDVAYAARLLESVTPETQEDVARELLAVLNHYNLKPEFLPRLAAINSGEASVIDLVYEILDAQPKPDAGGVQNEVVVFPPGGGKTTYQEAGNGEVYIKEMFARCQALDAAAESRKLP